MGVKISGAELEIMKYLWERDEKCTFAELLDYFNENRKKDWCKQTLNTNILRLKKRGLLTKEKNSGKDRKSTRLNSSHVRTSRMPSSA